MQHKIFENLQKSLTIAHSGERPKSPEKPQKLMERFFGLVALKVLWGLQISRFGALLGF